MDILVMMKPVPDPDKYSQIRIDDKTKRLVREGVPSVINPADRCALEEAIRIRESAGGKVTVISMTPESCRTNVLEALAMGADEAYMLSDIAFAGADTYATSRTLAEAVKYIGAFDLILAGNESADGATSHVPAQTAEWLGIPHICKVNKFEMCGEADEGSFKAWKKTETGRLVFQGRLPVLAAVSCDINKPRHTSAMGIIKAKKKPLTVLNAEVLGIEAEDTGLSGSPTQPGDLITPDMNRTAADIGEDADTAASAIADIIKKAGVL